MTRYNHEIETAILKGAEPGTEALERYILSHAGQAVLAEDGFGPPAFTPLP